MELMGPGDRLMFRLHPEQGRAASRLVARAQPPLPLNSVTKGQSPSLTASQSVSASNSGAEQHPGPQTGFAGVAP